MEQLSILDLPLQPADLPLPVPLPAKTGEIVAPKLSQGAIDWYRTSIRYYQKLQIRFFSLAFQANCAGTAKPAIQVMRGHEVSRLQDLINALQAKLEVAE